MATGYKLKDNSWPELNDYGHRILGNYSLIDFYIKAQNKRTEGADPLKPHKKINENQLYDNNHMGE